jgi:hypothetical protein
MSDRAYRLTMSEERDLQAAFERDKWAGEWNSLPTAIERLLRDRGEATSPAYGRSESTRRDHTGDTCHCDGPPHTWSRGWCPDSGPVSGRR